ncbi:hypothetical protein [Larkinella soli]|uniref:hypothetical protein n=1 Tax=Larkinella soli TaxID=1770527 RepID=UPI000FFB2F87|nr:hypothetical protein [Larkinella soli]
MKKVLILGLMAGFLLPMETLAETAVSTTAAGEVKTVSVFKRKKARGYRKKKGFMWGLFRKKNPCGCPNH